MLIVNFSEKFAYVLNEPPISTLLNTYNGAFMLKMANSKMLHQSLTGSYIRLWIKKKLKSHQIKLFQS